jgi:hypothetical protein
MRYNTTIPHQRFSAFENTHLHDLLNYSQNADGIKDILCKARCVHFTFHSQLTQTEGGDITYEGTVSFLFACLSLCLLCFPSFKEFIFRSPTGVPSVKFSPSI